jgi:hypothetical protein
MADLKKRRTSLVRDLLGHDAAPQKLVLRGMATVEKTLTQRFQELNKQRARLASANAPLRDKLLGLIGKDPEWAADVRRKQRASTKSPPLRRVAFPKALRQKEHISLGSLGGTRLSPFDYQWTWSAKTGPAGNYQLTPFADASHGYMDVNGGSFFPAEDGEHPGSISARAAVGIFFSSPSECVSTFSFWGNGYHRFSWEEYCTFASAHSDGFIGLFAASYDWAGNFSGTVVDKMFPLWSNDSWWNDASGSGSSDGFSLAANFQVDPDHWYALWVLCGSDNSGDGPGLFLYGAAYSRLTVKLLSIGWQVG